MAHAFDDFGLFESLRPLESNKTTWPESRCRSVTCVRVFRLNSIYFSTDALIYMLLFSLCSQWSDPSARRAPPELMRDVGHAPCLAPRGAAPSPARAVCRASRSRPVRRRHSPSFSPTAWGAFGYRPTSVCHRLLTRGCRRRLGSRSDSCHNSIRNHKRKVDVNTPTSELQV